MPRDDLPPGSGTAGVAVAEQFTARNAHGQATLIRKRAASVHEDSLGGLHFGGGAADFELTDGSPVVRVDESSYRIVHTGEVLRREEGQHRSTCRPDHPTPASPLPPAPSHTSSTGGR